MENNCETSVKQRLTLFIKTKGLKPATFERMCGFSNGYLKSLKKQPSLSKIEKICEVFPELNKDWLITGRGDMEIGENCSNQSKFITIPNNDLVAALQSHIADLQSERDRLLDEIDRLRNLAGLNSRKKETA